MSEEVKKSPYLIQYTKQTSMLGEQVTISTNLPGESTSDDIGKALIKMGNGLHARMLAMNAEVLSKTGKNLEDMGIEPGTIYQKETEEE